MKKGRISNSNCCRIWIFSWLITTEFGLKSLLEMIIKGNNVIPRKPFGIKYLETITIIYYNALNLSL